MLGPKRHLARAGTGTAFSPRAGTGTPTSPYWHHEFSVVVRYRVRYAVPKRGAQFQHGAPPCGTVPQRGCRRPSSSTGRKCGPSSSTGLVPNWGPTYIYIYTHIHIHIYICNVSFDVCKGMVSGERGVSDMSDMTPVPSELNGESYAVVSSFDLLFVLWCVLHKLCI